MSDPMNTAWWSLRLAFFLGPLVARLDKFFNLLTHWDQYLSPMAQRALGSHTHQFMMAVEIIVALMVITSWTKPGAYLASVWLLLIAINLVMCGQSFDIALRDIGLCLSVFGLARMTSAIESQAVHVVPIEMPRAA
jgi:lysylphosphatidylglycerol synthetase-like protein (DUF2156 family)